MKWGRALLFLFCWWLLCLVMAAWIMIKVIKWVLMVCLMIIKVCLVIIVAVPSIVIAFFMGFYLGTLLTESLEHSSSFGWYWGNHSWKKTLIVVATPILLACSAFILIFVFQDNVHRIIAGLASPFFIGFSCKVIKERQFI